jgi:hypothetical protein
MSNIPGFWLIVVAVMAVSAIYHAAVGDIDGSRYYTIVTLLSYIIQKFESIFIEVGEQE